MTVGYQKKAADASWAAILQFLAMSEWPLLAVSCRSPGDRL